ncbi:MAG TPA: hypothetical protein VH062_02260 [Polyangiaceae bacterium]|jgi:hypothetical protein|nr:hypothetical protein [Polyangiaceae bacterium]
MKPGEFRASGNSVEAVTEAAQRFFASQGYGSVKLSLLPSDVHDPTELPTYLAGYRNADMRADDVSPIMLVDKDQDKFRTFSSDDTYRRVDVKGSAQGMVPEVDPSSSLTTYKVIDRFIGSFIPDQTEANATNPNYKPRVAAGKRCSKALMLDREIDILGTGGLLVTAANLAAANRYVIGAGQNWNGGTASDPILDIQTMGEQSAQEIAFYAMNRQLANAFVRHPKVKDHYRQFNGDAILGGAIQQLNKASKQKIDFDIPGVGTIRVVAGKVKNETTGGLDFIFPKGVVSGIVVPDQSVPVDGEEVATSYTFRRRGPNGTGFETREFRVENRGPYGGTMVVASMGEIGVITSTIAGVIATGAYV